MTDRRTDVRTDGRTYGQTDGRTEAIAISPTLFSKSVGIIRSRKVDVTRHWATNGNRKHCF